VVMGLGGVLALVLGLVLARLWCQRRDSRSGEVTRWFQAHGTPACTSVMRAISVLGSRPVVATLSALIAIGLVVGHCWSAPVELLLVLPRGILLNTLPVVRRRAAMVIP
jgi:hypothetical protein